MTPDPRRWHRTFRQAAELSTLVGKGQGLDVQDAIHRFLRCLETRAAEDAPLATIVSDTGSPFEFSFTSRPEVPSIRLLGEATEPGESSSARCLRGIESTATVAAAFGLGGEDGPVAEAVEVLLPPGEHIAQLRWAAAVWLALRTDGKRNACRAYVNLQWRPDDRSRLHRIEECLRLLGAADALAHLEEVIALLAGWSGIVGLSLDLLPRGIAPARLHLDPGRLPARRVATLLRACGADKWRDELFRFAGFFEPFAASGPKPFLLSIGLGPPAARSLKLDANLRAVPALTGTRASELLERAEAIAGRIEAYHSAKHLFARPDGGVGMQYIGLTVDAGERPHLNVYLAPPPLLSGAAGQQRTRWASHEECATARSRLRDGANFLHSAATSRDGGLLMEARGKSSERRRVPEGWTDVYMTALTWQEARRLGTLPCAAMPDRLADAILRSQDGGAWRYLPSLPPDADDTAMALITLLQAGHAVPEAWVARLLEARSACGGFVTFFGSADQSAHPAVTLNVVHALDLAGAVWDTGPTEAYLARWIRAPDFPTCPWSHSPLFPLYLLARTSAVHRWLGATVGRAVVHRVLSSRRGDGLWGTADPELLDTALAVLCLAELGQAIGSEADVELFLASCQLSDGGWGWCPLYSDGSGTWFGHRVVSTILAMGGLRALKRAGPDI